MMRIVTASALASIIAATMLAPSVRAATLPAFSPDIVPSDLSVTIKDQVVTDPHGNKTETASFHLETPFTSSDFTQDLLDLRSVGGAVFIVGVAPSKKCKTGETTLTPITIPMQDVDSTTGPGGTSFEYSVADPNTIWSIVPYVGGASQGGNQSVTCINGQCTTSGGGTSIVTSDGNSVVIVQNGSGAGNPPVTPTDVLTYDSKSTVPGTIQVPKSAVDVFILYNADNDSDDSGSGNAYEGACVTLHSTSVTSQSKTVNKTKTVTTIFAAH